MGVISPRPQARIKAAPTAPVRRSSRGSPAPAPARVFLMDDHPLVREWLAGMIALERDLVICGQAEEAEEALGMIPAVQPDIVIVDLSLPRGSGLELIKDLRVRHPKVRLLVLTTHDDAAVAIRAFRAGAHGYAIKRDPGPQIIEAVRAVLAGKFYASPSLTAQLAGRLFGGAAPVGRSPDEILSDREMEVFQLRGQGRTSKEIAGLIHVSAKTVGSYEARIKQKLGLNNAGALMREAVLWADRRRGL